MRACRVISGGDTAFNALLYQPPSDRIVNFFRDSYNVALETSSNVGGAFIDTVKSVYNKYYGDSALNAAKMVIYNTSSHTLDNIIMPTSYENFNPNLMMMRYIMSLPKVDELYRNQRLDGYSDVYVDPEPDNYGKERHHYMAAMTGVIDCNDDEDSYATFYSFGDEVIDRELSFIEQETILDTWESVQRLMAEGKDPTDLNNL